MSMYAQYKENHKSDPAIEGNRDKIVSKRFERIREFLWFEILEIQAVNIRRRSL
jgi:hypothetical protein